MSSAEDFKQTALTIRRLAEAAKPTEDDPYAQERRLIQYHLNVAAGRTKAIAEALEKKEQGA